MKNLYVKMLIKLTPTFMRSDAILVLMVKTAVLLGKCVYQAFLKINASLAFTNNVKGSTNL